MPIAFRPLPPLEYLQHYFAYDPETGILSARIDRKKVKAGTPTPASAKRPYLEVKLLHRTYAVHRIAWYFISGEDPDDREIDHINGDPRDNRACNLRLTTHAENMRNTKTYRNNKLQARGVYAKKGRFVATIYKDKRAFNLGYFNTASEASIAYRAAEKVLNVLSRTER